MAALDREALVAALFERLQTKCPDVRFWTRRWVDPAQAFDLPQPAAVLVAVGQTPNTEPGMPTVWDLSLDLVVYVTTAVDDVAPDTQLNRIIQHVEDGLLIGSTEDGQVENAEEVYWNFAGAMVHARIGGEVDMMPGESTGQGVAIVPITVRAYSPL